MLDKKSCIIKKPDHLFLGKIHVIWFYLVKTGR